MLCQLQLDSTGLTAEHKQELHTGPFIFKLIDPLCDFLYKISNNNIHYIGGYWCFLFKLQSVILCTLEENYFLARVLAPLGRQQLIYQWKKVF